MRISSLDSNIPSHPAYGVYIIMCLALWNLREPVPVYLILYADMICCLERCFLKVIASKP